MLEFPQEADLRPEAVVILRGIRALPLEIGEA
jgi:hypothetical protein